MKAAVLHAPGPLTSASLKIETRDVPELTAGEILVAVRACGVCRTDLQIVEGALPPHRPAIVPGHQIVGIVSAVAPGVDLKVGTRVGISWLAGTDGTCRFCRSGEENLCDAPTFTGYDTDGGYATEVIARADFAYPLSDRIDDIHTAPLLCAGIIGFRALRVAGTQKGERAQGHRFPEPAQNIVSHRNLSEVSEDRDVRVGWFRPTRAQVVGQRRRVLGRSSLPTADDR